MEKKYIGLLENLIGSGVETEKILEESRAVSSATKQECAPKGRESVKREPGAKLEFPMANKGTV
jgi:hypothetical protein